METAWPKGNFNISHHACQVVYYFKALDEGVSWHSQIQGTLILESILHYLHKVAPLAPGTQLEGTQLDWYQYKAMGYRPLSPVVTSLLFDMRCLFAKVTPYSVFLLFRLPCVRRRRVFGIFGGLVIADDLFLDIMLGGGVSRIFHGVLTCNNGVLITYFVQTIGYLFS